MIEKMLFSDDAEIRKLGNVILAEKYTSMEERRTFIFRMLIKKNLSPSITGHSVLDTDGSLYIMSEDYSLFERLFTKEGNNGRYMLEKVETKALVKFDTLHYDSRTGIYRYSEPIVDFPFNTEDVK